MDEKKQGCCQGHEDGRDSCAKRAERLAAANILGQNKDEHKHDCCQQAGQEHADKPKHNCSCHSK